MRNGSLDHGEGAVWLVCLVEHRLTSVGRAIVRAGYPSRDRMHPHGVSESRSLTIGQQGCAVVVDPDAGVHVCRIAERR
jgi:hypothetical protein